jgi:hypothetical protein
VRVIEYYAAKPKARVMCWRALSELPVRCHTKHMAAAVNSLWAATGGVPSAHHMKVSQC